MVVGTLKISSDRLKEKKKKNFVECSGGSGGGGKGGANAPPF